MEQPAAVELWRHIALKDGSSDVRRKAPKGEEFARRVRHTPRSLAIWLSGLVGFASTASHAQTA